MTLPEVMARYRKDFRLFAKHCLRIHTKDDELKPFILNPPQEALLTAMLAMLATAPELWIRIIILKARQMGVSTLVSAFIFWLLYFAPTREPARALVMCQDDVVAKHLKNMYGTFWENIEPALRQDRVRSNDHEEEYANGSYLSARTASTVTGGRGRTFRLAHWSELAFWPHAEEHAKGALNQVARGPGSVILMESTANGATGSFYERFRSAANGQSDFRAVFLPWTLMPEYAMRVPDGFELSLDQPNALIPSEVEYQAMHGCSMEQMAWRHAKIEEFNDTGADGSLMFAQEYPITAEEAFLTGGQDSFCSPAHVAAARTRNEPLSGFNLRHPLRMGLDPATAHGPSASALIRRRGRIAHKIERLRGLEGNQLQEYVRQAFLREGADGLFIDASEPYGVYLAEALSTMDGLHGKVHKVKFGESAHASTLFPNRRTEIWERMRLWLADATIPDERTPPGQPSLAAELLSVRRLADNSRIGWKLESKKDMKARGIPSPDGADALACTFALPETAPGMAQSVVVAPGPFEGAPPSPGGFNPWVGGDTVVAPFYDGAL